MKNIFLYILKVILISQSYFYMHCTVKQNDLSSLNIFTLLPHAQIKTDFKFLSIYETIDRVKDNKKTPNEFYIPIYNEKKESIEGVLHIKKDVSLPSNVKQVSICCPGYSRGKIPFLPRKYPSTRYGGGLLYTYAMLHDTFLHGPIVTCDSISQRKYFNLGQELDQKCLQSIHQQIISQVPNARIVLFGTSLGSFNVLKFAQTNPKNVDTLVLHSPVFSAKRILRQLCQSFVTKYSSTFIPNIAYKLFPYWFPNFDPKQDTLEKELENIRGYNIFIAHYEYDEFVSNEDVNLLISKLKIHNNVHFISTSDAKVRHSHFSKVPEIIEKTNEFYKNQGLLSS